VNLSVNANLAGWARRDVHVASSGGQFQSDGPAHGELPVEPSRDS
jgi:hypothetical protein